MIFGKTDAHKQSKLKYLHENRVFKFVIYPVRLHDGRFAWLQGVWVKYKVECWMGRYVDVSHYRTGGHTYYLTETGN